jgi:uncharacterized protein with beta-barrel porin domain
VEIQGPVVGSVVNNSVVGAAVESSTSFLVLGNIGGSLVNNGSIFATNALALDVSGASAVIFGGITNTGLIASTDNTAVLLESFASVDRIINNGSISGFIGIDGAEGITISNGIRNGENGSILGETTAIRLTDLDGDIHVSGGIINGGVIEGDIVGIHLETGGFSGGIRNRAHSVISGGLSGESLDPQVAIWIEQGDGFTTFEGGLTNQGLITAYSGGFVFQGDDFEGDIVNTGTIAITGLTNGGYAAVHVGDTLSSIFESGPTDAFAGSFTNTGTIDGGFGAGVVISADQIAGAGSFTLTSVQATSFGGEGEEFDGGEGEEGGEGGEEGPIILGDPIVSALDITTAELLNSGLIEGDQAGVIIDADTVDANFTNAGTGRILSAEGTALYLAGTEWNGNLSNAGLIEGGGIGALIASDRVFSGKSDSFSGNIDNSGTILGGETGMVVFTGSLTGNISNSGTIMAGYSLEPTSFASIKSLTNVGLLVEGDAYSSIDGQIVNSGLISGDNGVVIDTGLVSNEGSILNLTNSGFLVAFSNSGTIIGTSESGVGVEIDVGAWYGSIENSGTIRGGETGFLVNAGAVEGDFINDGTISGGGTETGLHIIASTYTGDIVNNNLITASGLALHTEIGNLTGSVVNAGTIIATANCVTAVLLEGGEGSSTYSGGFTNTGLIEASGNWTTAVTIDDVSISDGIVNDGGTIIGDTAIDASLAEEGPEDEPFQIINTGGGIIEGDILLGADEASLFIGRDGGVRGQISGSGGGLDPVYDDDITIEDGTQFIVGGVDGIGTFSVENGGTALLGTEEEGVDGEGFEGTEVSELHVHDGGRLYLDDDAMLDAEGVTLDGDSELVFYLTAEEEYHGAITTTGTIMIGEGARMSVALDAASFAGSEQTDFEYDGVINAGSIVGAFENGTVHGSPFFELEVDYGTVAPLSVDSLDAAAVANNVPDPDSNSVNLLLHRISFADLSCSTSSQNNEALGQMLEAAFQAGDLTADQLALYQALLNSTDGCAAADAYDDLSGTPFDFLAFQLDGPFKKMVGARIDSGRATGCIVAGSSGCFDRYAANTTAGSNVMTDAAPGEDPFAWLKTGVRAKGTDAIWARGVGSWGQTDGDTSVGAPGTRSNQRGGIIGADHVFSEDLLAGAAIQYTETRIKFPGHVDRVHVNSYEAGAYMSLGDTQGYVNANLSYIWHNFDTSRLVDGLPTAGRFDGDTISGYVEAGRIYEAGNFRIQPILALSLSTLKTEGYTEQGASLNRLVVQDSSFDCLKSVVGGRFAYPVEFDNGRRWVPEARISWSHELLDNSANFDARLFSFPDIAASYFTTKGAEADRNALILGTGVNAPVSDTIILYADYDATLSSDQTAQTASGGLRILW